MTTELDDANVSDTDTRGLSRRQMIRASAVAGAAAWTAPVIIDSLSSPAAAFTTKPCPDTAGDYYAVIYSPTNMGGLQDRDPNHDGYQAVGPISGCTNSSVAANCRAPAGYGRLAAIGGGPNSLLTASGFKINHDIGMQYNGPTGKVTITLRDNSCCQITGIKAHVHKYQSAGEGWDCPDDYCQQAVQKTFDDQSPQGAYLLYNAITSKTWDVWPNSRSALCSGTKPGFPTNGNSVGIHWGAPNKQSACAGGVSQAQSTGQSFGYMLITLHCDPTQPH
jgi:hypothetical protein